MPRTLLCLARHGETNWNLERRFQGRLDIALNYKGPMQAAALDEDRHVGLDPGLIEEHQPTRVVDAVQRNFPLAATARDVSARLLSGEPGFFESQPSSWAKVHSEQ